MSTVKFLYRYAEQLITFGSLTNPLVKNSTIIDSSSQLKKKNLKCLSLFLKGNNK